MIIANPTEARWTALHQNCLAVAEDIDHLNQYPYAGIRVPNAAVLIGALRAGHQQVWLIERENQIVGFINYGSVIPGHHHAFGLVIGRQFASQGLGSQALQEFVERRDEFRIKELNGYCNEANQPIIHIMERCGFQRDEAFQDQVDLQAVKYALQGT